MYLWNFNLPPKICNGKGQSNWFENTKSQFV